MAGNLTLALIKPHAVREKNSGEILQRIEKEGFSILLGKITQLTEEGASEFYEEHVGKDFFANLVKVMSSSAIWALVLSKENAVESFRNLIGHTDPSLAAEGSLRNLFGNHSNITNNVVHGSATDHDARREIQFFFERDIALSRRINEINNE